MKCGSFFDAPTKAPMLASLHLPSSYKISVQLQMQNHLVPTIQRTGTTKRQCPCGLKRKKTMDNRGLSG